MTAENPKNQDVAHLQERVSLLESEASRRDVIDRIRTVIQRLPDEDYEAVLEAITVALKELGVSYEDCCVQVVEDDLETVTMHVKGSSGWYRYTQEVDLQLVKRFQRESAPVYRPDLMQDDPFDEAHWASNHIPPVRCIVDAPWSHGTLSVNSAEPNAFTAWDIETLAMLAAVLSEAFIRIEDLRRLKERNEKLGLEIMERKRAEEAVQAAHDELELRVEERTAERQLAEEALLQSSRLIELGEMAAGMAHELNQPLTVISALAEGVKVRLEQGMEMTPERLQEWSEKMVEGVERMSNIIDHLQTFSRDRSEEPHESVALSDVARGALALTQGQLKSRGIELSLDLDEGIPRTMGDRYRLEQVLVNLVQNGRDAVEEWREVLSSEGTDWEMGMVIRTYQEQEQVVLEVQDNGVGMDEETRLRVLQPFFTTKGPDRGTGLGLSISYAIVKDHGGEIECESHPGEGAAFRVRLPVIQESS